MTHTDTEVGTCTRTHTEGGRKVDSRRNRERHMSKTQMHLMANSIYSI